jgi:hypothetical protein
MERIDVQRQRQQWGVAAFLVILSSVSLSTGCERRPPLEEKAYVAPERLKLKSSTAQAARYIAELPGGTLVTITDREASDEGILWAEIRGPQPENRVGWVEARFLVNAQLVESSRQLEAQIRSIPTQAHGRSKATLKVRLTPDRAGEENVVTVVPSGSLLEIVGRERHPRPPTSPSTPNEGENPLLPSLSSAPPDQKFDDWYLVRTQSLPIAPAGWIYGGSVMLDVPPEIAYFVSDGRRITGWQKLGSAADEFGRSGDHYLVLEHRIAGGQENLDYDRLKILAYDPLTRGYRTPFREDLAGRYPVSLSMLGSRGYLEFSAADRSGQVRPYRYQLDLDAAGSIRTSRLAPPPDRIRRR